MSATPTVIRGIVRKGVVVLDPGSTLPDGTAVNVTVAPIPFTPEEEAEFAGWEKLGDEAWEMIDEWEKEDGSRATG
jgi:hypothetical protein